MNKFLKHTFLYLFSVILILIAISGNVFAGDEFAGKDRFRKNIKKPTYMNDGTTTGIISNCKVEKLKGILTVDNTDSTFLDGLEMSDILGDFSIDLDDKWCSIPVIAAYGIFKYSPVGLPKVMALGGLITESAFQFHRADAFFNSSELCGENWFLPKYSGTGDIKEKVMFDSYEGSYSYKVEKCLFGNEIEKFNNCEKSLLEGVIKLNEGIKRETNLKNQTYREYIYGGKEYVDNKCKDSRKIRKTFEGLRGVEGTKGQTYYMTGRFLPNYACERFAENADEFACCLQRSQNAMCISSNNGKDYTFCTFGGEDEGGNCEVPLDNWMDVKLEIRSTGKRLCATTVNLCPYNHNLTGGTQKKYSYEKDECKVGQGCYGEAKNFCQLNKHCSIIPGKSVYLPKVTSSPYFDRACLNFVGSTQNIDNFGNNNDITSNNVENIILTPNGLGVFTSPFVECIKETMENMFLNKAGHSECRNHSEYPNKDEICKSGYYYYKGQDLSEISGGAMYQSSFSLIQERIRDILRLMITLVIMIYGVNIIMGAGGIDKKTLMILSVKIGLVYYFAVGNAWKDVFFDGVYNASTTVGEIVISATDYHARDFSETGESKFLEDKLDGCQFTKQSNPSNYYNYGKKTYLSIFDTVDCKIFKYLGAAKSGPLRIFSFIFASIFTGPIGILLFLASILFVVFLITFVIKAVYIFLTSFMSLLILIYLSPIIIPLVLFKKTKKIFDSWLKNLFGFIIQPIILYVYLSMFLVILDSELTGTARFQGESPRKDVNCSERCETLWGDKDNSTEEICKENVENLKWIDPKESSLLCSVINSKMVTENYSLKGIGLSLPNIALDTIALFKVFVDFLKAVFVIYIFSTFLNLIPGIAKTLSGSRALPETKGIKTGDVMKKISGGMIGAKTAIGGRAGRVTSTTLRGATRVVSRIQDKLGVSESSKWHVKARGPLVKNRTGFEKLKDDLKGLRKFGADIAEDASGLIGQKENVKNIRKLGLKEGIKENIKR